MNHSDIEHMAKGLPPSSIGKDHEEVVIFLAKSLLTAQQKLDAVKALAGVAGEMNAVVKDGFAEVVAERDALAAKVQKLEWDSVFIPKDIEAALAVMGVALPESKEEFNFSINRWIQRLVDRVIRIGPELVAERNNLRAEGIIMFASKQLAAAGDLDSTITLERLMLDAEEFASKLR